MDRYVLEKKDILSKLEIAYCLDPEGFIEYFKTINTTVDAADIEANLKTLATIYAEGKDKDGSVFGTKIDLNKFMDNFQINHSQISKNSCNLQLTNG